MTSFFKKNLFTGFVVLLPISLFVLALIWLYRIIAGIVGPFTLGLGLPTILNILIILAILVLIVFLVGIVISTKAGTWFFAHLNTYVLAYLPGYKFIKQLLEPFIGDHFKNSLQSVALVDIWDNGTLMTAFVTDKTPTHITVFVPTGPNPTSGNIYHVPINRVRLIDAKIDQVLRSVISVGAGSSKLIDKLEK